MLKIAIVGATGLVGTTFLKVLEERDIRDVEYSLFSSYKSAGKKLKFFDKEFIVKELTKDTFITEKFDYALFSAGSSTSKEYAPIAANNGCIVIDNSSQFRMDLDVPLVVPEANPEDIFKNKGIISNPNCSTIQALVALAPLHKMYSIKRIVFSTYQAVSGAGKLGIDDLVNTSQGFEAHKLPYPIYNNCIPQIDVFEGNGYTKEEMKMINETRKILHEPNLPITVTCCVRVPVINCHSEGINIEFEKKMHVADIKDVLSNSEGIILLDNPLNGLYPINSVANGKDQVFVRKD